MPARGSVDQASVLNDNVEDMLDYENESADETWEQSQKTEVPPAEINQSTIGTAEHLLTPGTIESHENQSEFLEHITSPADQAPHTDNVVSYDHREMICRHCAHIIKANAYLPIHHDLMKSLLVRGIIPAENCRCSQVARERYVPLPFILDI